MGLRPTQGDENLTELAMDILPDSGVIFERAKHLQLLLTIGKKQTFRCPENFGLSRQRFKGHLMAEMLKSVDVVASQALGLEVIEKVSSRVGVLGATLQQMVDDHHQRMGHRHVREPGRARHRAGAPVRGLGRLRLQGAGHDFFHLGVGNLARSTGARLVRQAFQSVGAKALPPLAHAVRAHAALSGHGLVGKAFPATQHDAGSQGQALRRFRSPRPLLQFRTLLVRQNQRFLGASCTHSPRISGSANLCN